MPAIFSQATDAEVKGIASPLGSLPASTRVGKARLAVSDLQASLDFYRDVIGLRLLDAGGQTTDGVPLVALGTPEGIVLLELAQNLASRRARKQKKLGLYHTAFLLPSRADLGSFVSHLARLRYPYGSSDHLVSEAVYLVDPDGLTVEVYADRSRSEWAYQNGLLVVGSLPLSKTDLVEAAVSLWDGVPKGTTMGHIHFYVADLARSSRFYHEAMGLAIVMGVPGALFVSAGGYHHHVGYNVFAAGSPHATDEDARVLFWELVLPDRKTQEAVAMRLADFAVQHEKRVEDQPTFTDPDGISVVLRPSAASILPRR